MFELLTRENITLILAIFGSVGTVISWILHVITSRKAVAISLGRIYEPSTSLSCFLLFENKSRLPISITSIAVLIDDIPFPCVAFPHAAFKIIEKKGNIVTYRKELQAVSMPLNLAPLCSASGFLDFDIPPEYLQKLSTPLILQVSTNRGRLKQIRLEFEGYNDPGELL